MPHATLDDWIQREAIPFSLDSPASLAAAVDKLIATLGNSVQLLGLGEPLHGGEDFLLLRNRLFQRLVHQHGYTAIAVESSFPRAHSVNQYIAGRGPSSYEDIQDAGFSHNFGRLAATRELIEWMRTYNLDSKNRARLHFYGFDSPTEMTATDSPRQLLHFALAYLASIDTAAAQPLRRRIDPLLGDDSAWENPEANFNPAKSIGLSPAAAALRTETEDLITHLQIRRPELIAHSDEPRFSEALRYAEHARQMLTYHAGVATPSTDRIARLLGLRDAMMADNLDYIISRERGRATDGARVLAFAHNSHLKTGQAQWQLGPDLLTWWPAGAQLTATLGPRYAVIGAALGSSEANGIAQPEPGTLEALLTAAQNQAIFIPTHRGQGLPTAAIAALPVRSGSTKNSTYFPLTANSLADFDCLAFLPSTSYNRGGPPLQ